MVSCGSQSDEGAAFGKTKGWGLTRKGSDPGSFGLEGGVEDAEPAGQVFFDRELFFELGLQLELLGVVALLPLARRDEGPERTALVAVDPVHGMRAAVEAEDGRQELPAEALLFQTRRDSMHGGDLVLELRIADDDPRESERVLAALELRGGPDGDAVEQLLQIVLGTHEVAGRQRLEADRARARRSQPQIRLQRHGGRRQREQALARGSRELFLAEENVAETH